MARQRRSSLNGCGIAEFDEFIIKNSHITLRSCLIAFCFDPTTLIEIAVNDLCNVSKVLELILFADDTNIFYSHTDASYLMEVVNVELKKITC